MGALSPAPARRSPPKDSGSARSGRKPNVASSLRLGKSAQEALARTAARKSLTESQALHQAVALWLQREDDAVAGETAYDKMRPFIGVVSGGDPSRSVDAGRKVAALLAAKRVSR